MKQNGSGTFVTVIGVMLFAMAIACQAAEKSQKGVRNWTYSGKTGPDKWAQLEKDYAQCRDGQFQSPIDIIDSTTRKGDFPDLLFVYKPSAVRIVDNGHTIEGDYDPGSTVTVGGHRYELKQFQFHRPSEDKINGRAHDMAVDLVHKDAAGKLAVISVLLDHGKENAAIKTLWANLPKARNKEVDVPGATINAVDLLPDDKGYYSFAGSLTTPPCTEDVTWFVLKTPTQISADQLSRFEKAYPMNARPVQPVNGRDIMATR